MALVMLWSVLTAPGARGQATFVVKPSAEWAGKLPKEGRLFVMLSRRSSPEPRLGPGWADARAEPFFGKDITNWDGKKPLTLGSDGYGFPVRFVKDLPPGKWFAQALYDTDTTFSYINAPGNAYGAPVEIEIAPGKAQTFTLTLDKQLPEDALPPDTQTVKHIKIQSKRLSEFWKKPMYLRAGVILPKDYNENPERRYPVRYNIGGYHSRYTRATRMASRLQGDDVPPMITVCLDGEAPFGDSYQVNSANNGPYGDATVQELIPEIEKRFRAIGTPQSRFLDGGSTGGWVALALQIFYPDLFNGAWSYYADGVDFRYFQLVNIYRDENAFINRYGVERPSMRDTDGEPQFSVRREIQMENALGRGNSYVTSGGQWGGWNAVYGPKGKNGLPSVIWDPETGTIDRTVAETWKPYDLRLYLETNWKTLGPKLAGKLHIYMGDMDNFYLNNAMRLMEKFLQSTTEPKSDAVLLFGPQQGHGWHPITEIEMMQHMTARVGSG
ncbi:MAG: hypothetical protein OHK0029_15540 [Armatimonadaceae bacterium]